MEKESTAKTKTINSDGGQNKAKENKRVQNKHEHKQEHETEEEEIPGQKKKRKTVRAPRKRTTSR